MNLNSPPKNQQPSLLWCIASQIPITLPVGIAVFGLVAVIFLLIGQFRGIFIWPVGGTLSVLAMALTIRKSWVERPGGLREQRLGDLLIIIGVTVWIGLNIGFASQHVFTDRDPAAYSITGAWLARNHNLDIETIDIFGDNPELQSGSSGFTIMANQGDRIYPHGEHLLPALLGAAGKIIKEVDIFKFNVLLGGAALLAFYAFARLFVRPRWAIVGVGAVALSLPMLYFSRDVYTEPLTAAFMFGALALLFVGQKTDRSVLWLLAGALVGAAVATRIDAILSVAALAIFAVIILALSKKAERKKNVFNVSLLAAGIVGVSAIGLLDAINLSPVYYNGHLKYLHQLFYLTGGIVLIGAFVVLLAWHTKAFQKINILTKKWRGLVTFVLVLLSMATLASRPWWPGAADSSSYAPYTVDWMVWYLGIPVVVLGVVGLGYAAIKVVSGKNLLLTAGVLVVMATACLYFVSPSITPDQVWASRRFLPVVMPGLAIFSVYILDRVSERLFKWWPKGRLISMLLAATILVFPLLTSWPFLRHSEKAQYQSIMQVCNNLPENAAVLWIGKARLEAVQPTRTFCDTPSMGYSKDDDFFDPASGAKVLSEAAKNASELGYTPIVGVYGSQGGLIAESERKHLITINHNFEFIEQTYDGAPKQVEERRDHILLAVIRSDGSLEPISR